MRILLRCFLSCILAAPSSFGAVTANSIWRVWGNGNGNNGGCYDPTVASPGTDFSKQAAVQKSYTDLVIGATVNQATSALNPIVATDVGNCYQILSGAGCTVQFATLQSQAGGVGTFNVASLGTAASVCTGNMGGALAALSQPTAGIVAGNIVYVRAINASGTGTAPHYLLTATQTFSVNGTAGNPITFIGYTTNDNDGGVVTVARTSGNITFFSITGTYRNFVNFIADGASGGTTTAWSVNGANCTLNNCRGINVSGVGFDILGSGDNATLRNCAALAAGTGFATASSSVLSIALFACAAIGSTSGNGFLFRSTNLGARVSLVRCIAAANATNGFNFTSSTETGSLHGCIAYLNGGDGLVLTGASVGIGLEVFNSIFVSNVGVGVNSTVTNWAASGKYGLAMDYNAYYNNGTVRTNMPTEDHLITLTANPFTDPDNATLASRSFALNSAAGGGALLKAAGFPGVMNVGGTSVSLDIGAIQSAGAGGASSSTQRGYTFIAKSGKRLQVDPVMYEMIHPQVTDWSVDAGFITSWWSLLGVAMLGALIALKKYRERSKEK